MGVRINIILYIIIFVHFLGEKTNDYLFHKLRGGVKGVSLFYRIQIKKVREVHPANEAKHLFATLNHILFN
jgi:hypothetical protein